MSAGEVQAGKAFVEVAIKDATDRGLAALSARLSGFSKTVTAMGKPLMAVGAAMMAPLAGSLAYFAATGDALDEMSARTGASSEMLSVLGAAAESSGASLESVEGGFRKMAKTISEANSGTKTATDALAKLGLTSAQLRGLSPDQQFELIGNRVAAIADPTERAAAAMEVFGKSGTQMLPMLSAGLGQARAEAQRLGAVWSSDMTAKAAAAADATDRMKIAGKGLMAQVGGALAPAFTEIANSIAYCTGTISAWIGKHPEVVQWAARAGLAIAAIGTAMVGLGAASKIGALALKSPLTGLVVKGGAAAISALASPVGIATAALVAGVAAWALYTESGQAAVAKVTAAFAPMVSTVTSTVSGVKDALATGNFGLAAEIAGTGIKLGFIQALSGIGELLSGIMGPAGEQLKSLGSDALQGNWTAVVADLGGLWANFCGGIVQMMTEAVDAVMGLWKGAVDSIANWLLDASGKGGVMGGVASAMLGIDMSKANERDRLNTMRAQEMDRKLAAASLPEIGQKLSTAKAATAQDTQQVAALERQLAEQRAKAAEPTPVTIQAQAAQRQQAAAAIPDIERRLAAVRTGGSADEIAALERRLAEAQAKAAEPTPVTIQAQAAQRQQAAADIPDIERRLAEAQARAAEGRDQVANLERFQKEQQAKAGGTFQYGTKTARDTARESIDQQVSGWRSAVTDWTANIRETAAAQAKEASDAADAAAAAAREDQGTKGADDYTAELARKLKDLNAQAAAEKADFETQTARGKGLGDEADAAKKLKWAAPTGTFSAYSLGQQFGATGGVDEKILAANEAQRQLLADGVAIWREWFASARNSVGAVWGAMSLDTGG